MTDFFQKGRELINNELYDLKKWQVKIKRKDSKYRANNNNTYDFQQYDTIRSFGDNIYPDKINVDEAEMDQTNLLENILEFNEGKNKKVSTYESVYTLHEGWELILNAFRSGVFPMKQKQEKGLRVLTPKQMLQRLPIELAQVKAGNISENLLT